MSAFSFVVFGFGVGVNFKPRFNSFISAADSFLEDKFIILGSIFFGFPDRPAAVVVVVAAEIPDDELAGGCSVDIVSGCLALKNYFCSFDD